MITLTTDYGLSDYYVGAMKGILYQISPQATIVDITHDIPPCDVLSGALVLREIWRTFPPKTIHVAVVDPGVGSDRQIILAQYAQHLFLVPDNGLITLIHQLCKPDQVNLVTNHTLFCQPISNTFHGRDIFAPVAAHLAKGIVPDQVGPRTQTIQLLNILPARLDNGKELLGTIIHVDRFGNLITNISAEQIQFYYSSGKIPTVAVDQISLGPVRKTFSEVAPGQPLAYLGSAGLLEIAVNRGRADDFFHHKPKMEVKVT